MSKKSINNVYYELLSNIEKSGIRYVIIRDDITINYHIKDLDILIDHKMIKEFHNIAKFNGFYLIKDGYLNLGKRVYLKIDNKILFFLDVHERIIYRGIEFMDRDKLLNHRFREKNYYRPSNEDFISSLIFHNILAKRRIQEKHYEIILELLKNNLDKNYIKSHISKYGLYKIFQELVENFVKAYNNKKFIEDIYNRAIFALILRKPCNLVRICIMYIRRYTVKLWGKRRGILVTFIGPDGSGKSTTIYEVHKRLREIGLSCSTVYLGPWGQSILHLQKHFRWLNPNPYREDYKDYYTEKRKNKPGPLQGLKKVKLQIRSALYYTLVIIEMWVRWLILVLPKLRRGEVVIADRYIYDILAGYKGLPMDYQMCIREKICNLYPRPDIGVFLESDPEIIVARKDQLTQLQLAHAIDAYRNIAKKYNFKVLDTNRNIESTLQDFEENLLPEVLVRIDRKKTHQN